MVSRRIPKHLRGVILLELAAALGLLALLIALAGSAMVRYQTARAHETWRQAAAWAAEAQLQRYRAGAAIGSAPPAGLMAEAITLDSRIEPGNGQWAGFKRVTVIATVDRPGRKAIRESVSGYLAAEALP